MGVSAGSESSLRDRYRERIRDMYMLLSLSVSVLYIPGYTALVSYAFSSSRSVIRPFGIYSG